MLARRFVSLLVVALASASVIVSTGAAPLAAATASTVPTPATTVTGIAKIRHVMIIMQENRSFDSYFGTYPGADGLAMRDGKPVACLPSTGSSCVRPFVDHVTVTAVPRTAPPPRSRQSTAAAWTASSRSLGTW